MRTLAIVNLARFAAGILRLDRLMLGAALLCAPAAPTFAEDELHFQIERFVVEGNNLLAAAAIDHVLAPARGEDKSLGDVLAALRQLRNAYREQGYEAVQVVLPEQDVSSGVIHILVIEPKISEIRVESGAQSEGRGGNTLDTADIERVLPALRIGQTPNVRAIDAAVRLANENPARRIQVELEAAAGNGILARVKVEILPQASWFSRLDDTGTVATGRTRLSLGVQRASIAGIDHLITAQATSSPERPNHNGSYSLGYRIPFFAQKLTLDFVAGHSDTDTGTTATPAGPLQFTGRGDIVTARVTRQLPPAGPWEHSLFAGMDYKSFTSICSVGSFGAEGCGAAGVSLTLQPASVGYSARYAGEGAQFRGEVSYSGNVAPGSRREDLFAQARAGATPNYEVLRAKGELAADLGAGWQGRGVLAAQDTSSSLVTAEQFGLGGVNSIRGYGERVLTNDRGWRLTLEAYTPGFGDRFNLPAGSIRAVMFHDAGATQRNNVQPGEAPKSRLAGAGLGLRMAIGKNFQAQIDWAMALVANAGVRAGDDRAHIAVMLNW
jgi:hemolysin activation/secretion protein